MGGSSGSALSAVFTLPTIASGLRVDSGIMSVFLSWRRSTRWIVGSRARRGDRESDDLEDGFANVRAIAAEKLSAGTDAVVAGTCVASVDSSSFLGVCGADKEGRLAFLELLRLSSPLCRIFPLVSSCLLAGDLDKRPGCERARDAFVGDWKDACFGVEGLDSIEAAESGLDASIATDVLGEVFRRLAGEASISFSWVEYCLLIVWGPRMMVVLTAIVLRRRQWKLMARGIDLGTRLLHQVTCWN